MVVVLVAVRGWLSALKFDLVVAFHLVNLSEMTATMSTQKQLLGEQQRSLGRNDAPIQRFEVSCPLLQGPI